MTQLDCTVSSCMYCKDNYCSKGDITISGKNASHPGDTCCESFQERKDGASNSNGHPSATVNVDCEAENVNIMKTAAVTPVISESPEGRHVSVRKRNAPALSVDNIRKMC